MSKISRNVRLLCWNHEPCFIDSEHLTPATFLRHRHLNLSGMLRSTDHVISRPQALHCTLLRSRPTSIRNCIAKPLSQKWCVRKSGFRPPSSRNILRPKSSARTSYPAGVAHTPTSSQSFSTSFFTRERAHLTTAHDGLGVKNGTIHIVFHEAQLYVHIHFLRKNRIFPLASIIFV